MITARIVRRNFLPLVRTPAFFLSLILACGLVTSTGETEQTSPQPAPAEQTVTSLGPVFDRQLADVKPTDALESMVERAKQKLSECPEPLTLAIFVPRTNDALFDETLAKARHEALEEFLEKKGLVPGKDFTFAPFEVTSKEDVLVREPVSRRPQLRVTSKPGNGTLVKPGETIAITMTATDAADAAQSGIRAMQVIDLHANGIVPDAWFAEAANASRCSEAARRPPPVTARYTVPDNPPQLVRLEATAEDFVGNIDRHTGIFPTSGDWFGRMTLRRQRLRDAYEHTIRWTFAVTEGPLDETGTRRPVRGRAVGEIEYSKTSRYEECVSTHNVKPTQFELAVTGERLHDRLIVNFPDPGVTDTVRVRCLRGADDTYETEFHDTARASFDMTVTGRNPFVVPPSDELDRVTTTMEVFPIKRRR